MRIVSLVLILIFTGLAAHAREILVPEHAPIYGNDEDGDIQIVELFDYRCHYCKQMFFVLEEIVKKHPEVKLRFIEYPIFGDESTEMSKSALAVHKLYPDKYFAYHKTLIKYSDSFSEDSIKEISQEMEMDSEKIIQEMSSNRIERILSDNKKLAKVRNVRGTPHLVIDGKDARGAMKLNDLSDYLDQVKALRRNNAK